MASLFDLIFDNNHNKPQYKNYYNNMHDNYYGGYYNYPTYNDYENYLNHKHNRINNSYYNNNNNKNNNNNNNNNNSNNNNNNNNNINKNQYNKTNSNKSSNKVNNNNINNNNNIKSEFSIKETNDSIIIETCLPNVDRNDIQVEIRDQKLIIQGEKKAPKETAKSDQQIELPSIEEYEEDKEEDKGKAVVYKYITIKNQPKVVHQTPQTDSSTGPFKKSLDLSNILPYLNLRNINSTFNNNILSIKISKLYFNNNYRVKIF